MDVNKYRGLCRRLINECRDPRLTHARKLVLLKLADLIDSREGNTAYPAFNTLAAYAGVSRDTAIRAVNIGKKIGLLIRVKGAGKRGLGGTSNRYGFRLKEVADTLLLSDVPDAKEVAGAPLKRLQASTERSSRRATQQSKDNLTDTLRAAPPSASFGNAAVVAEEEGKAGKKEVVGGEESKPLAWKTPTLTEVEYTPELRKLHERATDEVYTAGDVPRRFYRVRKQTLEEFRAEMAAKGMDMSASKRSNPVPMGKLPPSWSALT
jgi:hypothetical protein